MTSGRGTGPMTPRQPIELDFNDRCQFQLKHHQLGKNERKHNRFVAPSRHESGLFVYRNRPRNRNRKRKVEDENEDEKKLKFYE
jgi:hypothetical protein